MRRGEGDTQEEEREEGGKEERKGGQMGRQERLNRGENERRRNENG